MNPSATHPYVLHGFKYGDPIATRHETAVIALNEAMECLNTGSFAVTRITRDGRIFMSDDEIVTEWLRRKGETQEAVA